MSKLEKRKKKLKKSWERLPEKIKSLSSRLRSLIDRSNASKIAIEVTGGMGDHILAARFIRDLMQELPDIRFDIYCVRPGLGRWIFESLRQCDNILDRKADISVLRHQYMCTVRVATFVEVSRVKLKPRSPVPPVLQGIIDRVTAACSKIEPIVSSYPALDGYLGHYAVMKGARRHNLLHQMAGIRYGGDALPLTRDAGALNKHGLVKGQYITISNGYDEDAQRPGNALITKVYPHFGDVAHLLKISRPDLKIVQIGSSTSTLIQGADLNLINKTTLQEAATLIEHAALHVDNEGGLVHLASALGTRSCVVFGPTLADYFGYEGNINVAPRTCGGCWWMEPTWMTNCVKGHAHPPCMYTQQASDVAAQIERGLRAIP